MRGTWPGAFEPWMEFISRADFVFGPRLHGCISALAHGVPALLLTRDLRTREMAYSTGLPSLPLSDTVGADLADLVAATDLETFRAGYRDSYRSYVGLLDRLGLEHRLAMPAPASASRT